MPDENDKNKLEPSVLNSSNTPSNIEKARALRKKFEERYVREKRRRDATFDNQWDFTDEDAEAKRLMKLEENTKNGKSDIWSQIYEQINQFKTRDMAGYNNWAMGMISSIHKIIEICMLIEKDPLHWSKVVKYAFPWIGAKRPIDVNAEVNKEVTDTDLSFVTDSDLPGIHLRAKLDENNLLNTYVILADGTVLNNTADPVDNTAADPVAILRQDIDTAIVAWAEKQGYTLDPACRNGIRFLAQDGSPMTNDQFLALSQSAQPDENLQVFFKQELNLAMEQLDNMMLDDDNAPGTGPTL